MRFIHIADVHLGMGFESASFGPRFGKEKREGVWKNLTGIVDRCEQESIDILLIAGDFMEADTMKANWALDLAYLFNRIPSTHVVIIHGNHDPSTLLNAFYEPLHKLDHVTICFEAFETVYIEALQTSIYTHGWTERKDMTMDWTMLTRMIEEDNHDPSYRIAMFHGDMYSEGPYLYLDRERMKALPVDYIALGHIHKPDIVAGKIGYPGSLEPLDFSEQGSHGYILGSFEGAQLTLRHQCHMEWPFYNYHIDLTDKQSLLEVTTSMEQELTNQLESESKSQQNQVSIPMSRYMVRCYLEGFRSPYMSYDWSGAKQSFIKALEASVAYMEIVDNTRLDVDIERLEEEHKGDLIGLFIEQVKSNEQERELQQEILRTGVSLLLNHERGEG